MNGQEHFYVDGLRWVRYSTKNTKERDTRKEMVRLRMRRKDREVTEISVIREILDGSNTCYVAMVEEGKPYVIPLSYGYVIKEGILHLYLHSAKEGRKIRILQENPNVCFNITQEGAPRVGENPCYTGITYSSIVGNGIVSFIEAVPEKCEALSVMYQHLTGKTIEFDEKQANTVCLFEIISTDFSGKRCQ